MSHAETRRSLTVNPETENKIRYDDNLQKVLQNHTRATADTENIALLTE
jgi:hypothetical protein